jgi:hypothetical protein
MSYSKRHITLSIGDDGAKKAERCPWPGCSGFHHPEYCPSRFSSSNEGKKQEAPDEDDDDPLAPPAWDGVNGPDPLDWPNYE